MNTSAAIERLIEVARRQHKSLSTERTYAGWLKRYCGFIQYLDPAMASERKVEAFLTDLAKKYPAYQFAWSWAWLFPSHQPCRHPRTKETIRWRVLECNVQRAVREASQKLGFTITPHSLRHSYATHCVERGVNIKALQAAMGHVDANTTHGYVHAEAMSVVSPLDQ